MFQKFQQKNYITYFDIKYNEIIQKFAFKILKNNINKINNNIRKLS